MTGTTPASTAGQSGRDDLTSRIFRALYQDFDLLTIGVIHIVTPKRAPVFTGDSLGQIARQLTGHQQPSADPAAMPSPAPRHDPADPG